MIVTASPDIDILARGLILGPLGLFWIVMTARVIGLRTFSKMTVFDFITTVAVGSLLANVATATSWADVIQASLGAIAILITQALLAKLRKQSKIVESVLQNDPLLIVKDGYWLEKAMSVSRVSKDDVWAKLREANVTDIAKVRAVILETTGDISVIHGDHMMDEILTGVRNNFSDDERSAL